jgi:hypothetical protein
MIDLASQAARELRKVGIRVDWRATFEAFVELHGGLPIKHAGRLLFADGWGHALDYKGPVFPPPRDKVELARLKLVYQREKRKMLLMEVDWLSETVGFFDEAQRLRGNAPLQRRYRNLDEQGSPVGPALTGSVAEAVQPLRDRLRWSREQLKACEQEIAWMEGSDDEPAKAEATGAARYDE